MGRTIIDLNDFKRDSSFYGELHMLATIKNFDLQAIRARYLASKQNKNARTGSVERRAPAKGGILSFSIANGAIISQETLTELREPRGIASQGNQLAFSSEDCIYLVDAHGLRELHDPWFSYIHTVDYSSDGKRLLVSSSGFDLILEFDLASLNRSREWWAWENGFDQGIDPSTGESVTLSRKSLEGVSPLRVIADPKQDSLPTAMRAAFINSVEYDEASDDRFIATFFHAGAVYTIDALTGESRSLIQGLKNPHGGQAKGNRLMATSTRSGKIILQDANGEELSYSFAKLPNKPAELGNEEWIQNAKLLSDGSILAIDSNRTSWVIFHPEQELVDIIPYPDNLAVQDLVMVEGADRWTEVVREMS